MVNIYILKRKYRNLVKNKKTAIKERNILSMNRIEAQQHIIKNKIKKLKSEKRVKKK